MYLFSENTLISIFSGEPPDQTFSIFKKEIRRGGNKKIQRIVFLAGRSGQTCPLGGGAELRYFVGNRFELWNTEPPNQNYNGNCRPLGRFFLWRRAAPASCFLGGSWEIAMPAAWSFC